MWFLCPAAAYAAELYRKPKRKPEPSQLGKQLRALAKERKKPKQYGAKQ